MESELKRTQFNFLLSFKHAILFLLELKDSGQLSVNSFSIFSVLLSRRKGCLINRKKSFGA